MPPPAARHAARIPARTKTPTTSHRRKITRHNSFIRYTDPRSTGLFPLASRSPWSDLESERDRLFEAVLSDFTAPAFFADQRCPVDLYEDKDHTFVRAELPGVTKDGLEFSAGEGRLTVRGRRAWTAPKEWTSVYRESLDAPFQLELQHDNLIDVDKIHAELKDGVLRVALPKAEAAKPRKIAIN